MQQTIDSTVSAAQYQTWINMGLRNPACPPGTPFKSENTLNGAAIPGCFEKPVDCPPGSYKSGPGTNCVSGTPGGGGAGGAGGPGGGPGGSGGFSLSAGLSGGLPGLSGPVWDAILKRLQTQGSRFTPEVMAAIMGSIKTGAENNATTQEEEYNANLATRGLARSNVANEGYRQIRAGVGQQVQQTQAGLLKAKVDADFEDHNSAIQEGVQYLGQLQSYVASMTATQSQKEVAMAQIQLGYQQLAQQLQIFREEYAQWLAKFGLTQ
jgi:hypothetical protein